MLIFYAQACLRLYKFISIAVSDHWVVRTIECLINGSQLYSEQISFHLAFGQIFFKAVSSNFTCSKEFLGNSNYAYDYSVFHLHILIAKKHSSWFIQDMIVLNCFCVLYDYRINITLAQSHHCYFVYKQEIDLINTF